MFDGKPIGLHEVELTNGERRRVDIESYMVNGQAILLYLQDKNGLVYNWFNILTIRKVDEPFQG